MYLSQIFVRIMEIYLTYISVYSITLSINFIKGWITIVAIQSIYLIKVLLVLVLVRCQKNLLIFCFYFSEFSIY